MKRENINFAKAINDKIEMLELYLLEDAELTPRVEVGSKHHHTDKLSNVLSMTFNHKDANGGNLDTTLAELNDIAEVFIRRAIEQRIQYLINLFNTL